MRWPSSVYCLALLVGASVPCADQAHADEIAYHASPDPVLARLPRVGELTLQMGQGAVSPAAGQTLGVWTTGIAWGLPIDPLPVLKLRLELPVLEQRTSVQAGSFLGVIGYGRTLVRVGALRLGVAFEAGAVAPSLGGQTLEVAGNPLAEHDLHAYFAGSLPFTLPRLGVGLILSSTSFASANVELDYSAPSRTLMLRAGAGLPVGQQPTRWFAGIGLRLASFVELGASASMARDPENAALLELSTRWSVPSAATRTIPWDDADVRVLHAEDVRGRDLETFGVPGKLTIVEIGAEWCGPCRAARPALRALAQRPGVAVRLIDVDESPDFAVRYDVRAIPTFFVLDRNGQLLRREVGWDEKSIDRAVSP